MSEFDVTIKVASEREMSEAQVREAVRWSLFAGDQEVDAFLSLGAEAEILAVLEAGRYSDRPTTYEEALDNLTAENWHTERRLIEGEVARYRSALRSALRDLLEGEAKPHDDEALTFAEGEALRVAS